RAEGNATEGHRHVTVTDAALFGLHRVAGQSLNTQSSLDENIDITNAAVDDDAFPAIIGRLLCQHVAQQGAAHGAAAIHHHDLAGALFPDQLLNHGDVLEALDRDVFAAKGNLSAEVA